MTVKELKEQLAEFPETADVVIVELVGTSAREFTPLACSHRLSDTGAVAILCNKDIKTQKGEWS